MRRYALYLVITGLITGVLYRRDASTQVNTVKELAPGVYFHEGDLHGHGHCNNGWIVFDDYVWWSTPTFRPALRWRFPRSKPPTTRPIRFAFDTHHHGYYVYGNQVWVDEGAVPESHMRACCRRCASTRPAYFGGKPGRWEDTAKTWQDVRESPPSKPPTLLFL